MNRKACVMLVGFLVLSGCAGPGGESSRWTSVPSRQVARKRRNRMCSRR